MPYSIYWSGNSLSICENFVHFYEKPNTNTTVSIIQKYLNPLSTNPIKWPNTHKHFVGNLPTNCLSVFGHFVNLALKGLIGFNFRVNI